MTQSVSNLAIVRISKRTQARKINCSIEIANAFDKLLKKFELNKALRVSTLINRFIKSCHHSKQSGSLTTLVIEKQINFYIKNEQKRLECSEKFNRV